MTYVASTLATVTLVTSTAVSPLPAGSTAQDVDPAGAPAGQVTTRDDVVTERFGSRGALRRLETRGPGRWTVRQGRLVLSARDRGRRDPQAVERTPVTASQWRLSATLRPAGRGKDVGASLLLGWRSPTDHLEVHLDARRSRSGIFAVAGGDRTRLAALPLRARSGRDHRVSVVVTSEGLSVVARARGDRPRRATVALDAGAVSTLLAGGRVGVGTRGGPASFDDLTVVERGPLRQVGVSTSAELAAALADARPGDEILLADGVYTSDGVQADLDVGGRRYYGTFVLQRSGTARHPIVVRGSLGAVVDGNPGADGTGTQYGLYLAGVSHVRVEGITVRNVAKGIVVDRSTAVTLAGTLVEDIGQEGIHLRAFTTDSVVSGTTVRRTGLDNPGFGEGVYVGTAVSNWGTYSDGGPDRSDRNLVVGNTISATGAESVDVKEGTTGGVVSGNAFDGAGMSGGYSDSWVDVKGNGWLVAENTGVNALEDGFQVHGATEGWGLDTVFRDNVADVNGPGYGFYVQDNVSGTVVACSNVVRGAASGLTNLGGCRR